MTGKRIIKLFGVAMLGAVALTACRAEEQDRMTKYEPGVYKGKPDTQLSQSQVDSLRLRALQQSGSVGTGISGGGAASSTKGSDVRAPSSLGVRALKQGGSK